METPNPNVENQSSSAETIEMIKPETLVKIEMSSGFYKKIQDLLGFILSGKSSEELSSAHAQISSQTVTEEWVAHYETLLILAREFENTARSNGFIVKVTKEEAAEMLKDYF